MNKTRQTLIILAALFFTHIAFAVHEPYVNSDYSGFVMGSDTPVLIHIEGQTHNVFGEVDYTNEWTFTLDSGEISFPESPWIQPYDMLSDFSSLDLIITEWTYWFDESEGLGSAYPKELLIIGTLNSVNSGASFTITTVPAPGALALFVSAAVSLIFARKKPQQFNISPAKDLGWDSLHVAATCYGRLILKRCIFGTLGY